MRFVSTILLLVMSFNIIAAGAMPENRPECIAEGYNWIEGRGCVVTQETVDVREDVNECVDLEGPALESCIQRASNNANNSTSSQHKRGFSKGQGGLYASAIIQVLGSGYMFVKRAATANTCLAPSYWLMFAGSAATLYGEIASRQKHKKLLKEASAKYASLEIDVDHSKEEQVSNKQVAAFQHLIDIENAREQAEKTRQSLYTVSLVSYAAAAVFAALEMWVPYLTQLSKSCNNSGGDDAPISVEFHSPFMSKEQLIDVRSLAFADREYEEYVHLGSISVAELIEISFRKVSNILIPSAISSPIGGILGGAGLGLTAMTIPKVTGTAKAAEQMTQSEVMRIALAVLLGLNSTMLMSQAKKNKETAVQRQKELQKIKDDFMLNAGIMPGRCTTEQRKDRSNPSCYCYTEDGSKDMRKSTLKICNDIWDSGFDPKTTNYDAFTASSKSNITRTCITKTYESDRGCECAKSKTCLKLKGVSSLNIGSGMANLTNSTLRSLNGLYSNGLETANFDSADYNKKAGVLKKKLDEMRKDPKFKDAIAKADKIAAKVQARNLKQAQKALENGTLNSLLSLGGNTPLKKELTKKKDSKIAVTSPRGSKVVAGKIKKKGFDLDFGDSEAGGIELTEEAKLDNSEYEYGEVLHKNPDHDIFKILSNRYMSTGVKKLFEE